MSTQMNSPAIALPNGGAFLRQRISAHWRVIAYWLISAPILLETAAGAQWDLARNSYVRETMVHLGYPLYFLTIMGVGKILALAALLAPRFPRLKQWAYAGVFFVYAGAACSHFAMDDEPAKIVVPIIFAVMTLVSWSMHGVARFRSGQTPPAHGRQ
jgi:hypothetical protein